MNVVPTQQGSAGDSFHYLKDPPEIIHRPLDGAGNAPPSVAHHDSEASSAAPDAPVPHESQDRGSAVYNSKDELRSIVKSLTSSQMGLFFATNGHCNSTNTDVCTDHTCSLLSPGCKPYTAEEKRDVSQQLEQLLFKAVSSGKCKRSSKNEAWCNEYGYCDLFESSGKEGCRALKTEEYEGVIRFLHPQPDGSFSFRVPKDGKNPPPYKIRIDEVADDSKSRSKDDDEGGIYHLMKRSIASYHSLHPRDAADARQPDALIELALRYRLLLAAKADLQGSGGQSEYPRSYQYWLDNPEELNKALNNFNAEARKTTASCKTDLTTCRNGFCKLTSPGCTPLTDEQFANLVDDIAFLSDFHRFYELPDDFVLHSQSQPASSPKEKRDPSDSHYDVTSLDDLSRYPSHVVSEASRVARQAVSDSTAAHGTCVEDSLPCRSQNCIIGTPGCREYTAEEKSDMRQYWTIMIAKTITTGKCKRTTGDGVRCDRNGYCDLLLGKDGGERDANCRLLSRDEQAELIETLEAELDAATDSPHHSDSDAGAKVKRDWSGAYGGEKTTTFEPSQEEEFEKALQPTKEELEEFMQLCKHLSEDPAALETIAEAAGMEDQEHIVELRERFSALADDEESATVVLEHAKEAQMLAESKLGFSMADFAGMGDKGAAHREGEDTSSGAAKSPGAVSKSGAEEGGKSAAKGSKAERSDGEAAYEYGRPGDGGVTDSSKGHPASKADRDS